MSLTHPPHPALATIDRTKAATNFPERTRHGYIRGLTMDALLLPPTQLPCGRAGGEVRFVAAHECEIAKRDLIRDSVIVVDVGPFGAAARGRLRDVVDGAIERELGALRAGPAPASACEREATLTDQLARAERAGAAGLAIVIGPLGGATGPDGALDPNDCATLRFFAKAAVDRPLTLILDAGDATTSGYGDPVALRDLIGRPAPAAVSMGAPACQAGSHPRVAAESIDPLARQVAGANWVEREQTWRNWTAQLLAARGPQPLASLERLFGESYVPLGNAIALGLDDPRARAAHDEFRDGFAKNYAESFPTFAATTKRPRMVLEVHDVAARIARLHGARSTRLLLVDSMRWDISRLVAQRVAVKLGARAALTDELVLWSALPTTTMRQLETIARGVEALRSPAELEADAEPPRGRTAEYVRRLRVGPREVHKLDLVEARLHGARGAVLRSLPEVAESVSDVIARHAETLTPHTLLFVFGDHGFAIDRTGNARHGGASPEEVLVGAFALLVGDVH